METGTPGVKSTPDGWLARGVPGRPAGQRLAVPGRRAWARSSRGCSAATRARSRWARIERFDVKAGSAAWRVRWTRAAASSRCTSEGVRDLLHGTGRETFEAVKMLRTRRRRTNLAPANGADYPRGRFGEALRQIAQLVRADVGRARSPSPTSEAGTRTSARAPSAAQLAHPPRASSAGARRASPSDLGDRMADVVVLTMSEFGRTGRRERQPRHRPRPRHGDAGPRRAACAAAGSTVAGRGSRADQLFEGRDLAVTTDFRTLFAEVAPRHLGVPAEAPLFPGFTASRSGYPGVLV